MNITLDLENYKVDEQTVGVRTELVDALTKLQGVYGCGEELYIGVKLADRIERTYKPTIGLTPDEHIILKQVINILIAGPVQLGGPVHNELICRIFKPVEPTKPNDNGHADRIGDGVDR